jgi:hypothetical protein
MKKFYLKEVRLELSKIKHIKGVKIVELYELFEEKFSSNSTKFISDEIFAQMLKSDCNLEFQNDSEVVLKNEFFKSQEFIENENKIYNFQYVKNIFKEEVNENILLIYKIIHDYQELNYTFISKMLKKLLDINNDIKQVAHYCKDLKAYNFIDIIMSQNNNNEKIIRINTKQTYNKDIKPIIIQEETIIQVKNNLRKLKCSYKKLEINEKEGELLKTINEDYISPAKSICMKNYIQERFSLVIDNSNVENNILFHLYLFQKLSSNEITLLSGMLGREKTVGRILTKMEKDNLLSRSAERKGKVFSFLYYLNKSFKVPERFRELKESLKTQLNSDGSINFNNRDIIIEEANIKTLEIKEENTEMHDIVIPDTVNEIKDYDTDSEFELDEEHKVDVKNEVSSPQSKKESKKKLKEKETFAPVRCDSKNMVDIIDLNSEEFKFIIDCIRRDSYKYTNITKKYPLILESKLGDLNKEQKIEIILDYFYNNLERIGAKSFSNISFNRYLFCLNVIREKKVINQIDLKKSIINDLESNNYGYQIDRKTLRNILVNLEKIGLIKLADFKLTISNKNYKYFQDKTELNQLKSIAIRRDIHESEEKLIEIINKDIRRLPIKKHVKKRLRKKVPANDIVEEVLQGCKLEMSVEKIREGNREKFVSLLVNKIEGKKPYFFHNFFYALRSIFFVNNNLKFLFSIEAGINKPLLFNFIDNSKIGNIILPKYIRDNYTKYLNNNHDEKRISSNGTDLSNNIDTLASVIINEDKEKESERDVYLFSNSYKNTSICIKNYVKEMHKTIIPNNKDLEFSNKYLRINRSSNLSVINDFNKNIANLPKFSFDFFINNNFSQESEEFATFLSKKRSKIKKDNKEAFDCHNLIDIFSFLQRIYFHPKISIKNLRAVTTSKVNFEKFLVYFQKLGLIQIQEIGSEDNKDYSIELDKNILLFIDIL